MLGTPEPRGARRSASEPEASISRANPAAIERRSRPADLGAWLQPLSSRTSPASARRPTSGRRSYVGKPSEQTSVRLSREAKEPASAHVGADRRRQTTRIQARRVTTSAAGPRPHGSRSSPRARTPPGSAGTRAPGPGQAGIDKRPVLASYRGAPRSERCLSRGGPTWEAAGRTA